MSLARKLLDAIVEMIASAFSKLVDGFSFLESLLGRDAAAQPASSSTAAVTTTHEPGIEATGRLTTSDSSPVADEYERVMHLMAENMRLTRKQDELQQIVLDLGEYALRLERDVELSDRKATQLAHELHHHRQLTISSLAMYHSAKHQLAAAELRQRVALAYVDELVAKYGRRGDGSASRGQAGDWHCALIDIAELEEL